MTCALCSGAIQPGDEINLHHPTPRSEGGTLTQPTHRDCHVAHHSTRGDFREWGRQGGQKAALTMRWAFNLLNVRKHPAYQPHRDYYLMNYTNAGWSAGLI